MIVTCPQCGTSFDLPDAMYRPGRKARCSSCGTVFAMPGPEPDQPGETPPAPAAEPVAPPAPTRDEKKGTHSLLVITLFAIGIIGLCIGGYLILRSFGVGIFTGSAPSVSQAPVGQGEKALTPEEQRAREAVAERVKDISLEEVRQFVVKNDKMGPILVIQGKAVNNFPTPKEMIAVEAHLLGEHGELLDVARQRAGVSLNLFQLQVSSREDLESALNNSVEIVLNNSNVPPRGEVPFCIVFTKIPEHMAEFEVRPIDAQDVQARGK